MTDNKKPGKKQPEKKNERPLAIDIPFDDALERFIQTDPKELNVTDDDEGASRMKRLVEGFGPLALGILAAVVLIIFHGAIAELSKNNQIDFANLFSAVFDWSAIQTGFLFAVLGYVSGKSEGFIAAVKGTRAMGAFNRFTLTAIVLGFVLTFFSIPMVVMSPKVHQLATGWYWVFAGWGGLSVWAFFSFARVAYIFGLLLRPKDVTVLPG